MMKQEMIKVDYSEFNNKYNQRDITARKNMHDLELDLAVQKVGEV